MNIGGLNGWAIGLFNDAEGEPIIGPEHSIYCLNADALQSFTNKIKKRNSERLLMCHGGILNGTEQVSQVIQATSDRVVTKIKERWPVTHALLSVFGKFT